MNKFYSVSLDGEASAYYSCQLWAQRELCVILAKKWGCFAHEVDLSKAKVDVKQRVNMNYWKSIIQDNFGGCDELPN